MNDFTRQVTTTMSVSGVMFAQTVPVSGKNRAPVKVGHPLQMVALDIVDPFPESKTVISDYFTRLVEANTIPNREAATVARVLTNEIFFH